MIPHLFRGFLIFGLTKHAQNVLMPKGDRHMTTEEKNLTFKLARKEMVGAS